MLELLAELEDLLGAFAGFPVLEQRLAILEVNNILGSGIEAARQ